MGLEQDVALPSLLEKLKKGGYESLDQIKEASVYDLTQGKDSTIAYIYNNILISNQSFN